MIYYSIPFDSQKNIGAYYNAFMRLLPNDDDFACFVDRDAMFTTAEYGKQLEQIISDNPSCGLFTAMASRIGCKYQRAGDWSSDDMRQHMAKGAEMKNDYGVTCDDITGLAKTNPLGGVLILIRKSTWRRCGGFPENGMLGIDNAIHLRVAAAGELVMLMKGVYLYHWYRGGNAKEKDHLVKEQSQEKKVVYTAIFGDYDHLKDPTFVNPTWQYICFTDNANLKSNVWKIILITSQEPPIVTARRIKINPLHYMSAEHSVWIDASIQINCDPEPFVKDELFVLMKHPHRQCLYAEAEACIKLGKDSKEKIMQQIERYRNEGYPHNAGLVATGIIYRRHTKSVNDFCQQWLSELQKGSIRDQLSFNYVARKMQMRYGLIDYVPEPHFKLTRHKK